MPGKGAPHLIFLPRQKWQARHGFITVVVLNMELRLIDGDGADFKRNSVGEDDDGGQGVTSNGSDGVRCEWMSCGPSCGRKLILSLRSDNGSRSMTPSWQLLGKRLS